MTESNRPDRQSQPDDTWPVDLNDAHRAQLKASGVPGWMASARGYKTVHISRPRYDESRFNYFRDDSDDKLIKDFGFSRNQRIRCAAAPTLLIPALDKRGEVWGAQVRPDFPYDQHGEIGPKYLTPLGQQMHIDVPPGCGPWLDDPAFPLWITEGAKKADSAHYRADLCIVALLGVWSWRGTNDLGGLMTLPDWEEIALNRDVVIAFDSDVSYKPAVHTAMTRLARWLTWRKATTYVCWLPRSQDKVGLDDYLMAGHTGTDLERLIKPYTRKSLFWVEGDWKTKGGNAYGVEMSGLPPRLAEALARRSADEH